VHESGEAVSIVVVDNGDGTYTCTYPDVKKAGDYKLTPLVDGEEIMDAPFDLSVAPGGTNTDNSKVTLSDHHVAGLPGIKVSLHDDFGNQLKNGGDKVRAHLLPLFDLEVGAKDNGDGTYDVDYPPHVRGDVQVKVKVNGKYAPVGPFDVAIQDNPVPDDVQQEVSELLPSTSSLFNHLLRDVSPADREAILEGLRQLSKGKRLPPAPAPEPKPAKHPNQQPKFSKPKREARKGQANPIKARAEIEEQGKDRKLEEKPKYKPAGGVSFGFAGLGAQVAQKQKAKNASATAEQRGETQEASGKAEDKVELKPEPAPARGAVRGPGMGVGAFDVAAHKAGLKKANQ